MIIWKKRLPLRTRVSFARGIPEMPRRFSSGEIELFQGAVRRLGDKIYPRWRTDPATRVELRLLQDLHEFLDQARRVIEAEELKK